MGYQQIHERPWYDIDGVDATLIEDYHGEPAVRVVFKGGFVFGSTTEHSEAKTQASKLLGKSYERMRVIQVVFYDERVRELFYAYRKATKK